MLVGRSWVTVPLTRMPDGRWFGTCGFTGSGAFELWNALLLCGVLGCFLVAVPSWQWCFSLFTLVLRV